MAVTVENLEKLERRSTLTLPVDALKKEVDSRLRRLARTMKADGFRPGKVPMSVLTQRYGPTLQQRLAGFFELRDRFPARLRFAIAFAVPILISLLITAEFRVTQTALKEQLVVLISLCCGYLALAPRDGDPLSGVKQLMSERRKG